MVGLVAMDRGGLLLLLRICRGCCRLGSSRRKAVVLAHVIHVTLLGFDIVFGLIQDPIVIGNFELD